MIPYTPQPVIQVGPFTWYAFGILLVTGCTLGYWVAVIRARRLNLARPEALCGALLVFGMLGAYAFYKLMHLPELLAQGADALLRPAGKASFGGLLAGFVTLLVVLRRRRASPAELVKWLDTLAFAFPFGFAIGRLGCALAHDHRGKLTTHWLGVNFPSGAAFDLGLLDFLYLSATSAVLLLAGNRFQRPGTLFGSVVLSYSLFRLLLDRLSVDAPTIAGLTPVQGGAIPFAIIGASVLVWSLTRQPERKFVEAV